MKPKISIIIATYNQEKYIEETLESILNQSLNEIEVIIVDDGSTDNTEETVIKYLNKSKKITYLKQANTGSPSTGRNKGIGLAKGKYISFVDSDDILPRDSLKTMLKYAEKYSCDIVLGKKINFDSYKTWEPLSNKKIFKDKKFKLEILEENLEILRSLGPCDKLYKSNFIKKEKLKFIEGVRYGEDQPFVLKAYCKAKKIGVLDEIIYKYRILENSSSRAVTEKTINESLYIFKELKKILTECDKNYLIEELEIKRVEWDYFRLLILCKSISNSTFDEICKLNQNLKKNTIVKLRNDYKILSLIMKLKNKKIFDIFLSNHSALIRLYRIVKSRNKKLILYKLYIKIAYKLFSIFPIQKNLTLLSTNKGKKLDGNLKFIHEGLKNKKIKNKVCLTSRFNFIDKILYPYFLSRSQRIILDDYHWQIYNLNIRIETRVIQVWHAAGAFKKFGFSSLGSKDSNSVWFENRAHRNYTDVVVSSNNVASHYAEAFNIDIKKIHSLGIPRSDFFFEKENHKSIANNLNKKYSILASNKRKILYAPTFRGNPKERKKFELPFDFEKLEEVLEESVLILKLHPAVKSFEAIPSKYVDRIINLSNENINELMLISDLLITDYSSLIFEYSLLKRPLIFYPYDLKDYLAERGFYFDYKNIVPGKVVESLDELIEALKDSEYDTEKIIDFNNFFHESLDAKSTERFIEFFFNDLNKN